MKEKYFPCFWTKFPFRTWKTKNFKTLKISISERVSEICQKNKEKQSHFSLFADLKIKTYEFSQKPT